jgi:hypothetical protein
MRGHPTLLAFNRGLLAKQALARVDLKRTALSAETMTNWMPRTLGSMMLRPGLVHLGSTLGNSSAVFLPFVFATDDVALIELTDSVMRVWVDDAVITRQSVATTITNGSFGTDLSDWDDNDESGATSAWATGGYMSLIGTGTKSAIRDQEVTVAAGDQGVGHGITIEIVRGLVELSVGSSEGGTQYIPKTYLRPGWHSISFTPTGNFHIRFSSLTKYPSLVSSVAVEAAGDMTVTTPWQAADLPNVRFVQSGDVLFCCDGNNQQQRIERQQDGSWSVVAYEAFDGPFAPDNLTPVTITPSALSGTATLTASTATFTLDHVGGLFRVDSQGQTVTATITAEDQWTSEIRVTGIDSGRVFSLEITDNTDNLTFTLQRSVGAPGDWTDVENRTTSTVYPFDDGLDNQIVYYRIGVKTGNYSGVTTPTTTLTYSAGSISGVGRVTDFTSDTVVGVDVISPFGNTKATDSWAAGAWSEEKGWPSAVTLYDGRLWWAGNDKIYGSASDAFSTFSPTIEGDSGPIARSIGAGPVDTIGWLLPLTQLIIGTQGAELGAKASSLEEPLTPTAFSLKAISTQGSARVQSVKVDTSGIFIQRNGRRVYEIGPGDSGYSYSTNDLSAIVPDIGSPGIVRIGVQRQPDTRIHCVRSDGTVAVLVYDKVENVNCWVEVETDGEVEDVVVVPGTSEDAVYYVVRRTIGTEKVYLEKWSTEDESHGGATTKLSDSSKTFAGPIQTVTGLSHLEGQTVVAWGNSKDLGTYTVSSGQIGLSESATAVTVGLPYTAQFKSARLILESSAGSAGLTQRKAIDHVGLILAYTHAQGLRYGQDFDYLDDLPLREAYADVDQDSVWTDYDEDSVEVNGSWTTDARLCLEAESPRPCTVVACVVSESGHVK